MASYPGSGHAWLANVLLELEIPYYDPYTELVPPLADGSRYPLDRTYRARFAAQSKLDRGLLPSAAGNRVIKTHVTPEFIGTQRAPAGVLVLVRSTWATVESYFDWRRAFVPRYADQTLGEFLRRPAVNNCLPLDGCDSFAPLWVQYCFHRSVPEMTISFEVVRQSASEIAIVCEFLGYIRTKDKITKAMKSSTFEAMRLHEAEVIAALSLPKHFVMCKGDGRNSGDLRR
jgi:hypothetical protein